jgi:cyclic peptide transporter
MHFIRLLQSKSGKFFVFIALLGVVNSLVYGSIMVFINTVLTGGETWATKAGLLKGIHQGWIYAVLLSLSFLLNKSFQTYIAKLTNGIVFEYESGIIDKLRISTYASFERLGVQRVYTAIQDTRLLAQLPTNLVNVINSIVIVGCGLVYMFWLSWKGGVMVLAFMALLLLFYLLRNRSIEAELNEVRDLQNDYHGYLRDFLNGFREVKMSLRRSRSIYESYLKNTLSESRRLNDRTSIKYLVNELTGNYSWFLVLGIVLFVMPIVLGLPVARITAFVIMILYIMGPVATVISSLPFFTRLKIAIERIEELDKEITQYRPYQPVAGGLVPVTGTFRDLVFRDVHYAYTDAAGKPQFGVGPFNLTIRRGEVIFVTGGNGSGKSTFINLLCGIYPPSSGELIYNGQMLEQDAYPAYSDGLSAIFTNAYLFSENYDGFDLDEQNPVLRKHVGFMKMQDILRYDKGKGTIDPKLSMGQRKRLAFIYALLEDKDVLILDEWAAEQDPYFRAYFYEHMIPALKEMNKTVIAVTHDDKYYDMADRILHFDFGRIVRDERRFPVLSTTKKLSI